MEGSRSRENDLSSQTLRTFDLHLGRGGGQHHNCADTSLAGRKSQRLCMVPRGEGDDTSPQLFLGELRDEIEGPSSLEGTGPLEGLTLQADFPT